MEYTIQEQGQKNLFDRGRPSAPTMPEGLPKAGGSEAGGWVCDPALGICYVPMQEWGGLYGEDEAFAAGTVFSCLDMPFLGGAAK